MTWPVWIEISLKAAILLAGGWAANFALRRSSAATRHLVWTSCVIGMLALPLLFVVLPLIDAPRPVVPVTLPVVVEVTPEAAVTSARAGAASALDWRPWVLWLWLAVAAVLAVRLAVGVGMLARIIRKARPLEDPAWRRLTVEIAGVLGLRRRIRLRTSAQVNMPVSCGFWNHAVLLPESAVDWPEQRRRIVLLHEMAHAARLDPLTHMLAQAACCLYWFNPLAWLAVRRMAVERERACDDRVLASGAAATDYAGHLVEIARNLGGRKPWLAAAMAMASRSQLEPRLIAILNRQLLRRGLTPRRVATAAAAAALVVLPLAAMRPQSGNPGAISGVIYDGGGVVPNAEVTLRNAGGGETARTRSGAAGEYRFSGLNAGRYELFLRAPGFAEHRIGGVNVAAGTEVRQAPVLRVGAVSESMDVVSRRPATLSPPPPAGPKRIRVGGHVQPVKLLRMRHPSYPEEAKAAGVEGYVALRAVIQRDGTLGPITVLDAPHPALGEAAREAVSQWLYEPARLNGDPVEVETAIQIRFRLTQ
jgi:TonB family protein